LVVTLRELPTFRDALDALAQLEGLPVDLDISTVGGMSPRRAYVQGVLSPVAMETASREEAELGLASYQVGGRGGFFLDANEYRSGTYGFAGRREVTVTTIDGLAFTVCALEDLAPG
jgi:hypothetical protein